MSRMERTARDVFVSLLANKQRTMLMMLCVGVGVAVLSAVIAIGQGTRERVMDLVQVHNLDMIMVRAGGEVQVFAPGADRGLASLSEADARAIESEVPNVELLSGTQNKRDVNVVFQDRALKTRAFGVEPNWAEIRYRPLAEGEFISAADMASTARVVVLGSTVAKGLFPEGGAVGQVIRIENDPYTVKGVFTETGATANPEENFDDRFVIPMTTSAERLFNRPYLEQIVLRVPDLERIPQTAENIRALLRTRHSIGPGEQDDFFVREPTDVVDASLETSRSLFSLMLGISIVALIASGLVIMNVMLTSVAQRASEIGLRRATGARTSDITLEFLLESLFVALAGGLIGVVIGLAIASGLEAAELAVSRVTWVPFAVALVACTAVGLAFGAYPARKAAHIDPAATLRGRMA
jgi:ABC-type antimicrobial peptide transport system permease subunit